MKRVRSCASGILVLLMAVFVGTHLIADPDWPILLTRAMAEAGMIGGLADWFAVEALFRRPLGLPIPHTAILPNKQQQAAENVGRFFVTYFLEPGQIQKRLLTLRPAAHVASWLAEKENAQRSAQFAVKAVEFILGNTGPLRISPDIHQELRRFINDQVDQNDISAELKNVLRSSLKGKVTDRLLLLVRTAISENREMMVDLVQDRSRWWIASRIDRQIADVLVNGVLSVIDELSTPGSELRERLDQTLDGAIVELTDDGTLAHMVSVGKDSFMENGVLERLLDVLALHAHERVLAILRDTPDSVATRLADAMVGFAKCLKDDQTQLTVIDEKIAQITGQLTDTMRPQIGAYVTDVIANWDAQQLIDRFETEVGRDLQFIRINGAVLGAMIGGIIFAFVQLVA